jgi:hypothetical protein
LLNRRRNSTSPPQIAFQLRVAFAGKVIFNFLRRACRDQVIDLEQVVDRRRDSSKRISVPESVTARLNFF